MEQDLMKRRVKVMLPYPGSPYKVGEILIDHPTWSNSQYPHFATKHGKKAIDATDVALCSDIFRPIPWYAEREAGMMPEYVKSENGPEVYKIARWDIENMIGYVTENGICSLRTWNPGFGYEPATLTQYEQYIKNLKK